MIWWGFGMVAAAAAMFTALVAWGDRRIKNEDAEMAVATALMLMLVSGMIFAFGVQ